jgi:hypothetical protein
LPLELIVKRQTSETADFFGFSDRGRLAPGKKADINVIDFKGLRLHTPEIRYDLPAGGRRLVQRVDGYVATFVSGTPETPDSMRGALAERLPPYMVPREITVLNRMLLAAGRLIPAKWQLEVVSRDDPFWKVDTDGGVFHERDGRQARVHLLGSDAVIEVGTTVIRVPLEVRGRSCALRWKKTDKRLKKTKREGIPLDASRLADALHELGMQDVELVP